MKKLALFAALLLALVSATGNVFAGPPFNNLQGVGGRGI
jgi:hypothetical protein